MAEDDHPLQRAHRFFRDAAPAIREAGDAIVQRIDEVVTNATAIEGTVVEHESAPESPAASADPPPRPRATCSSRRVTWLTVAVVAAAATYGALAAQRRRDDASAA